MDKFRQELTSLFGHRIRENEPLTAFLPDTSLIAPLFFAAQHSQELEQIVTLARNYGQELVIIDLDNLSSLTSSFTGIVVKNNARKFEIAARKGKMQSQQLITDYALVEAESGVPFSQLVRYTIEEGLGGLEYGLGIKGSLGKVLRDEKGIKTYLSSSDIVQSVTILTQENERKEVAFSDLRKDLLVLSIVFKLRGEDPKILWLKGRKAAEDRGDTEYSTI